MYKNAGYKSQFWTDHEIYMVGAGPLTGELYGFWKPSAQQNHRYGENMPPKPVFYV